MAIKYEDGVGGTSTATVHGGTGVPLSYVPFVDPNAITDPYAVQPPLPAGSTTHINNPVPVVAPSSNPLPTVVKIPGSGDTIATAEKPVILQGEPTPVYEPTMSPSETAEQNLSNAPVAQPTPDIVPENVVTKAGLGTGTKPTGTGTKTTGSGTGVVSGSVAGAPTVQATQPWKEYLDKAINTEFSYNPATDNEYKLASAQIEQQVTNMMVGRGGLYSSVAQSALTNKLMELQVAYQKQAYDKFLNERDYNMKIASFLADRSDTEFNQNLSLEKFKADLEQQKFQNSMAQANLRIAQANSDYNRQVAQAKTQQAAQQNQLYLLQGDYAEAKSEYDRMIAKWKNDGQADAEVASFFGSNVLYMPFDSAGSQGIISSAYNQLAAQANYIKAFARQTNDGEIYLNTLEDLNKQSTDATQIKQQYDNAYLNEYNNFVAMRNSGISPKDLLKIATSNYNEYLELIGSENYNKLLSYLDKQASAEK